MNDDFLICNPTRARLCFWLALFWKLQSSVQIDISASILRQPQQSFLPRSANVNIVSNTQDAISLLKSFVRLSNHRTQILCTQRSKIPLPVMATFNQVHFDIPLPMDLIHLIRLLPIASRISQEMWHIRHFHQLLGQDPIQIATQNLIVTFPCPSKGIRRIIRNF